MKFWRVYCAGKCDIYCETLAGAIANAKIEAANNPGYNYYVLEAIGYVPREPEYVYKELSSEIPMDVQATGQRPASHPN